MGHIFYPHVVGSVVHPNSSQWAAWQNTSVPRGGQKSQGANIPRGKAILPPPLLPFFALFRGLGSSPTASISLQRSSKVSKPDFQFSGNLEFMFKPSRGFRKPEKVICHLGWHSHQWGGEQHQWGGQDCRCGRVWIWIHGIPILVQDATYYKTLPFNPIPPGAWDGHYSCSSSLSLDTNWERATKKKRIGKGVVSWWGSSSTSGRCWLPGELSHLQHLPHCFVPPLAMLLCTSKPF